MSVRVNQAKNRDKKRNIFPRIFLVLASLVFGGNIYLWNARNLAGNAMPMPFGFGVSVVLSGSMEPVLSVNDMVIIRKTDELEEGDIIVYQKGHELIIHRIIEKEGNTILTQGDANSISDSPVNSSDVKGKLVLVIPWAGAIVRVIKTPVGTAVILAAALLLLELSYRKEKEQGDKELEQVKEEIRRLKAERERGERK